jgi:hypothetical protein
MEDDLRKEYDLKSLKVRKLGSERKSFSGSKIPNNIENEINVLIEFLEKPFISKRTQWQNKLINVINNTEWKTHQRYFIFGSILFLSLSFITSYFAIELFRINKNDFWIIIFVFFIAIFLFAFSICFHFWMLAYSFNLFETYQDELNIIKEASIRSLRLNYFFEDKKLEHNEIQKFVNFSLKNQFEFRIYKLENRLKFLEPFSYFMAATLILISILYLRTLSMLFILNKASDSGFLIFLFQNPINHPFLLSIIVFAIVVLQSILRVLGHSLGTSKMENHQECLILLDEIELINEMEIAADSVKEIRILPNKTSGT